MGQHPHDVTLAAENAGDVAKRTIWIVDVSEHYPVLRFEFVEGTPIGVVAALPVSDGDAENLAYCRLAGEWRIRRNSAEFDLSADELQPPVADQRSGQKAALDKDLEAITDTQYQPSVRRELAYRFHDWRELRDGSASQV